MDQNTYVGLCALIAVGFVKEASFADPADPEEIAAKTCDLADALAREIEKRRGE